MKKIAIGIAVFAMICVAITAGMIHGKRKIMVEHLDSGEADSVPKGSISQEKTIDLYGTFSENDLLIETISTMVTGYDKMIDIPQISGLKDKTVEEKINSTMKQKIMNTISSIVSMEDVSTVDYYYDSYRKANFSNVLSLYCSIAYRKEEKYASQLLFFNYNLVDGSELKLEDLFAKNVDIGMIVRMALYKEAAGSAIEMECRGYGEPYYDKEKGAWYATYHWIDYENDYQEHEEIREYIPEWTEAEIEKKIKKYLKQDNKEFFFNTMELTMHVDGTYCSLFLKDIADKVVIYDKFLTKESIFECSDIGIKSLITCTAEINLGPYKETKYVSNNFFYDKNVWDEMSFYSNTNQYPSMKYWNEKEKEEALKLANKVEEYKKIADSHPENAYFLFCQSTIYYGSEYENEIKGYRFNNLLSTELGVKLITCPISEKQKVLDSILNNYRYHNLGFYGDIYHTMNGKTFLGAYDQYEEIPVEETTEKHLYDVLTGKEITSVKEIFKEGVDYDSIIKNYVRNGVVESYEPTISHISVHIKGQEGWDDWINYSEIESYLNLKELKTPIFPSSARELEKSELEELDKDDLYRAYNEIFARHGHDFQTPEFKHYFSLWDWYHPVAGKNVSLEELNEVERYNATLIKKVIDEK